jgi:hypothetical protein
MTTLLLLIASACYAGNLLDIYDLRDKQILAEAMTGRKVEIIQVIHAEDDLFNIVLDNELVGIKPKIIIINNDGSKDNDELHQTVLSWED